MENMEQMVLDNDILELQGIDYAREHYWLHYKDANQKNIPRVTNIISQCVNQEHLIQWAANVGRHKYDFYRNNAMEVGTYAHQFIESYLECKYIRKDPSAFKLVIDDIEMVDRAHVVRAVENFFDWEANLNTMGYFIEEIIGLEVQVTCPWFGGTIDAIVRINGAVYIIDFKTSKQISNDYLVQAAAYMWIVNNGYAPGLPHIDGIGIIRVDKSFKKFNDCFLNLFVPQGYNYLMSLMQTFLVYVEAYYRTISLEYTFNQYTNPKKYKFEEVCPIILIENNEVA